MGNGSGWLLQGLLSTNTLVVDSHFVVNPARYRSVSCLHAMISNNSGHDFGWKVSRICMPLWDVLFSTPALRGYPSFLLGVMDLTSCSCGITVQLISLGRLSSNLRLYESGTSMLKSEREQRKYGVLTLSGKEPQRTVSRWEADTKPSQGQRLGLPQVRKSSSRLEGIGQSIDFTTALARDGHDQLPRSTLQNKSSSRAKWLDYSKTRGKWRVHGTLQFNHRAPATHISTF